MIGIGTHNMHGLAKAQLNLEAIAVKREYLQRFKRQGRLKVTRLHVLLRRGDS